MSEVATAEQKEEIVNISVHLTEMARRYPDKPAVIHAVGAPPHTRVTFRELESLSTHCAAGLARVGVARGMRTIVMVRPSRELFALTFALFKLGAVPVLIDPGMGRKNLVACLADVEAEAFIGIPLAHVLRVLHFRAFRSVRIRVTVGSRWFWGGHTWNDLLAKKSVGRSFTSPNGADTTPPEPQSRVICGSQPQSTQTASPSTTSPELCEAGASHYHTERETGASPFPAPSRADDTAAVLFTSGSTGPAKGVVYTHGIFDAQVRYLHEHFGYGPEEVDLASFPLFALFDAALGMTAVIPDMDASRPGSADPRKIADAIQRYRCTHMFGSPALLENLSRCGVAENLTLPSLRRVVTAGAPVRPNLLERMHKLLSPDAEVFTPYGATEALPVASIGSREILNETKALTSRGGGTCIGRPLRGMSVRVIEITDAPIATWRDATRLETGEIGEIAVKGPVVTREYFRRPQQTAAAKIRDGEEIVHRMGDVGYLDARGRLWMCGRKAHRVVTESGVLFTVPCEAIFNQHPAVRRSALVGVGPRGRQRPVICIELEPKTVVRSATSHPRHFSLFTRRSTPQPPQQLVQELLALAAANDLTREIKTVLFHPSFPVDVRHNAKIFREKLARWAAEQLR